MGQWGRGGKRHRKPRHNVGAHDDAKQQACDNALSLVLGPGNKLHTTAGALKVWNLKLPYELRYGKTLESEAFEAYYKRQGICPEDQWPVFIDALRTGLPTAFRVNRGVHTAEVLMAQLAKMQDAGSSAEPDSRAAVYAPRQLSWYPHGLGWQWDSLCSWVVRKDPRHKKLKAYLRWMQEHGAVSRQEAVSMLPPLCLDVQPHHLVLDMCAAPGSKTSQMLEMLHWGACPSDGEGSSLPRGLVLANEIDSKRADVLKHSVHRLGSPSALVAQIDAQYFPNITDESGAYVRFDRVLCDVPCSGDGTLRKSPELWGKWTPQDANGLHHRQYTILTRGLDLLKVGGRLVYSTCSFNPVEDEAVVLAALRKHWGSVELRPVPALPGIEGQPGLATWVVPHPQDATQVWSRHEDVPAELQLKLRPSAFPPAAESEAAKLWQEVSSCCRRFLPHQVQGGGFFVAVFERVSEAGPKKHGTFSSRPRGEDSGAAAFPPGGPAAEPGTEANQTPATASRPRREKPVKMWPMGDYQALSEDDPGWLWARDYFGLSPKLLPLLRIYRKKIYCVSPAAKQLLDCKVNVRLRVTYVGVRLFQLLGKSSSGQAFWRLAQEGLRTLWAFGLQRRLLVSRPFLARILGESKLPIEALERAQETGELQGLTELETIPLTEAEQLQEPQPQPRLRPGSLALALQEPGQAEPAVIVTGLLSGTKLECFVDRVEAAAILESLDLHRAMSAILAEDDPGNQESDAGEEGGAGSGEESRPDDDAPPASKA